MLERGETNNRIDTVRGTDHITTLASECFSEFMLSDPAVTSGIQQVSLEMANDCLPFITSYCFSVDMMIEYGHHKNVPAWEMTNQSKCVEIH